MAEVKWIKLYVGLPSNRKLRQIRRLPSGDTIALMWVFLMCLAGETNDNGSIYFTKEIPYTDEMLADEFDMDVNTVRLGLNTFKRFGMIDLCDDVIFLSAWEKYQSTDKLAELREYNRLAKQRSRAKQKLLQEGNVNDTSLTSQPCQDTEVDKEKKKEKDKNVDVVVRDGIGNGTPQIECLTGTLGKGVVYLTPEQDEDLMDKLGFEGYNRYIEKLADFIIKNNAKVANHYQTILKWHEEDTRV